MEEIVEKLVNFELDVKIKKELDIISKRDGVSLKEILGALVADYVKAHKDGNDQHLMTNFIENEDFTGFPSIAISFMNKKEYVQKYLQADGRLNTLGVEMWGHVNQWFSELQKL